MARIFYKKEIFNYEKNCTDEFGEYKFYFKIYRCFSLKGISYLIKTVNFSCNQKKFSDALKLTLEYLEKETPRYYRLKSKAISEGLANKLW